MAGTTQIPSIPSPRISRPNPFLFPSDTDFRFVLLIFSVVGSTLFVYNILSADFLSSQITATLHCTRPIQAHTLADIEIAQQGNIQCQDPYLRLLLEWLCGGIALVLLLAFLLYWLSPAWKIWWEKLETMNVEDAPDVVAYLKELCQEAGLVTPPRFVWNPLNQASSGLAFGHFRQYYIFLSGGLVTQVPLSRRNSLQPGLALMIGVIGGFVFCVILLIVRVVVHMSPLATLINSSIDYVDRYYYSQIGLAVILQAGISVLVVIRIGRQGILHGLLAAFAGGCVMTIGVLASNILFGGTSDPEYTWLTICLIINGGALLAIVVSTVASWISRQVVTGRVMQAT